MRTLHARLMLLASNLQTFSSPHVHKYFRGAFKNSGFPVLYRQMRFRSLELTCDTRTFDLPGNLQDLYLPESVIDQTRHSSHGLYTKFISINWNKQLSCPASAHHSEQSEKEGFMWTRFRVGGSGGRWRLIVRKAIAGATLGEGLETIKNHNKQT